MQRRTAVCCALATVLALLLAGTAAAESDRAWCNMSLSSETVYHNAYVDPGEDVVWVKCETVSVWGVGQPTVTPVKCKKGQTTDQAYRCDNGVISQSQWKDLQYRYNTLCYNCGQIGGSWMLGTRQPGQ